MSRKTMAVPCGVTLLLCAAAAVVSGETSKSHTVESRDSMANITFTKLPGSEAKYKSSSAYDEQGMHHLYALTHVFLSVVMDKGLAEVFVKEEFVQEPLQFILNHKLELFERYKLFIILAGLGVVLAILMPLIGLIVCCWRCRKQQDVPDSKGDSWKRGVLGLLMFILVVSMLFAIVCAFVTNEHTASGVRYVPSQLNDSISDIGEYLKSTQEDAEVLLVKNFDELAHSLNENIEHVGDVLRLEFSEVTDALSISELLDVVEKVESITNLLGEIKTSSTELKADGSDLATKMSQEQVDIETTMNQCQQPVCKAILNTQEFQDLKGRDYNQFPTQDIDDVKKLLDELTQDDIAGKIRMGVNSFNAINQTFQDKVDVVSSEISTKIREVGQKLKGTVDSYKYPINMSEIRQSIRGVDQWANYVKDYISYYRFAGIGIACITTIIFLFYSFGLMWGACSSHTGPCNASTSASLFLWGVTIFFLTYTIIQLPITAMYVIGTIVQRAGCDVASEPDSNTTQLVLEMASMRFDYNAPLLRFAAKSITNCRKGNWSLYHLLRDAEKDNLKIGDTTLRAVNFSVVDNYRKEQQLDEAVNKVTEQIEKATLDIDLLTPEAQDLVEKLKKVSFSTVNTQNSLRMIEGNPTLTDVGQFSQKLHNAAGAVRGQDAQTADKLTESANRLEGYQKDLVPKIMGEVATLRGQLQKLDKMLIVNGTPIVTVIDGTYRRVLTAVNIIQTDGKAKLRELAVDWTSDLTGLVDRYIDRVRDKVTNVIGRCSPLSTAYDASVNSVCKGVVLPFNGYWISIGWCLISGIPAMMIALWLVPLFRRLDPFLIPPSESDYISDTAYSERDTIPLAQLHKEKIMRLQHDA